MQKLLFILLILFSLQKIEAKNFYGIIVADIEDPAIGEACDRDAGKIYAEFQKFGYHNNATLLIEKFVGSEFSKTKILDYLIEIKPKGDDVIFFYYSGHGKYEQGLGKVLNIKDGDLELKTIESILDNKDSELKFVVTDCCSQRIPITFISPPKVNSEAKIGELKEKGVAIRQKNYQRLLNYEGLLVLESSQPGQFSYADDKGGIFTDLFINAIHFHVEVGTTSWKQILDKTRADVENYVGDNLEKNQIPVCDDTNLYQKLHSGKPSEIVPRNDYLRVKN